jgi:hypothetical protein
MTNAEVTQLVSALLGSVISLAVVAVYKLYRSADL